LEPPGLLGPLVQAGHKACLEPLDRQVWRELRDRKEIWELPDPPGRSARPGLTGRMDQLVPQVPSATPDLTGLRVLWERPGPRVTSEQPGLPEPRALLGRPGRRATPAMLARPDRPADRLDRPEHLVPRGPQVLLDLLGRQAHKVHWAVLVRPGQAVLLVPMVRQGSRERRVPPVLLVQRAPQVSWVQRALLGLQAPPVPQARKVAWARLEPPGPLVSSVPQALAVRRVRRVTWETRVRWARSGRRVPLVPVARRAHREPLARAVPQVRQVPVRDCRLRQLATISAGIWHRTRVGT
jgi:hypothetical protein